MKKKYIILIIILVIVLGGAGWYYYSQIYTAGNEDIKTTADLSDTEVDLEDLDSDEADLEDDVIEDEIDEITEEPKEEEDLVIEEESQLEEESGEDTVDKDTAEKPPAQDDEITEDEIIDIEDIVNVEADKEFTIEEYESSVVFAYQKTRRNPFSEYRVSQQAAPAASSRTDESSKTLTLAEIKANVPFTVEGIIGTSRKRLAVLNTGTGTKIASNGEEIDGYKITDIMQDTVRLSYRGVSFNIEIGSGSGVS